MHALNHWHPVIFSNKLKDKPVAVKLWDEELVIFRTKDGVAALTDRCPHRFNRLSTGKVVDGCIECAYHLWTFDQKGQGKSPCNPRMKPRAKAFDAKEYGGAIWVKNQKSESVMPTIADKGLHYVGELQDTIDAPMELIMDNFVEIEHSANNHFLFAFDAAGIVQVTPFYELKDKMIHVVYEGPQRKTPWWTLSGALGFGENTRLVIDLEVYFEPVYIIYDIRWHHPETNKLLQHFHEYAFLTPRNAKETSVLHWFWNSHGIFSNSNPFRFFFAHMFMKQSHGEFMLDKNIIQSVASTDPRTNMKGMALGVFDRSLRECRKYIQKYYHGPDGQPGDVAEAPEGAPDVVQLPSPRAAAGQEAAAPSARS